MGSNGKVEELLRLGKLNKKEAARLLTDIIVDICFYYMTPLSNYLYKTYMRHVKFHNFCEKLFTEIEISVNKSMRQRTSSDFIEELLVPVYKVKKSLKNVHSKHKHLGEVPNDPELLDSLVENSSKIFKRFKIRTRRTKKKSEVKHGW